MTTDKNTAENGSFRKRQSFTMASNSAIRDKNISLKAKGLYTLIMSYITMPDLILTKDFLRKRCMEGKKAFESAWIELKENGYLKIYIQPSSDHGRWCVQYDLLDEADLADGVHTFYRNLSGETTDTNITKKEKRIHSAHHTRTKQSPPDNNLQHIPHFGIYADGVYAKGYDAKGGNKLILTYNTSNNTLENHSIYQIAETYTDNSELLDQVIDDLITYCGIPYFYAADQKKMETAIRYLADWDSRQQCPYTNATGHVDEQATYRT